MTTKQRLWFLARLLIAVTALGYFWVEYRFYYPVVFEPVFMPVFHIIGLKKWYMALLLDHFTTWVPYAALVLASPDLITRWKRSLMVLFGGLLIILVGHFLLSWAVWELASRYAMSKIYYRYSLPLFFLNDILPLLLWLLFYPDLLEKLLGVKLFGRKTR